MSREARTGPYWRLDPQEAEIRKKLDSLKSGSALALQRVRLDAVADLEYLLEQLEALRKADSYELLFTGPKKMAAKSIWNQCAVAVRSYKRNWFKTDKRLRLMAERLQEYPERPSEILVWAIHGYVLHLRSMGNPHPNWRAKFIPENVYGPFSFHRNLATWEKHLAEQGEPELRVSLK